MAMSGGTDDGEPMMEMNTTPLIDVMLVLLIMFIITIPIQTHAVKVDLPQPSNEPQNINVEPDKNKVIVTPDGQITWNSQPINEVQLRQYLDQTVMMNPQPELHFQPDPLAKYNRVDQILAIIKRANVTKLGFVGNEQYRNDF
ncbi:ExbD/TolR family protein [Stakelama pacifica]|uniref:Outer membrane transport energization protein ExbD n=1 Tax=Stakelama pacifica TaxID=517720 RepID=A0A4R6F9T8_9SPHN|nr:biopolymer transporter ExbD [Stakelama pacifica]TDN77813.1 outer membrane transport energization protein ExbD [Stakelama pacifica]GGP00743.1 biopolymer transporter [Stakelama pacifica]